MAETKLVIWAEAHDLLKSRITQNRGADVTTLAFILGKWCFTDESWKEHDRNLGQGWYNTLEGCEGLMGTKNSIASLSQLHSEVISYGNEVYEEFTSVSGYICN